MVKIIGLGEHMVSGEAGDSIKTYALATCVGLVVYNVREHVLGMVHIVLPECKNAAGPPKGEGYFADTAVPLIFDKVFGGYPEKSSSYRVSLYGGCSSGSEVDFFRVGENNIAVIERILTQRHILYDKSNTGGHSSRTIEAYVKDGKVAVHLKKMII